MAGFGEYVRGDAARSVTVTIGRLSLIAWLVTAFVYGLGVLHAGYVVFLHGDPDAVKIRLFNLDGEANLPAWYSSALLLGAAVLLLLIATQVRADRWQWRVLSGLFVFLSLDEAARIHEAISANMGHTEGFGGLFYYSWVLIGLVVVVVAGLYFLPFLLRLRADTRWRVVLAGALFVGGALGMEIVGGELVSRGASALWIWLEVLAEEGMEFAGETLFLVTLARHLASITPELTLRLTGD